MVRFRGWLRRNQSKRSSNTNSNTNNKTFNARFFSYDTLRIATNNFSTFLGDGSYGSVYRGVLPEDRRIVAIKSLNKPYNGFLEMVEFMSSLRHVNLIQVIGCCVEGDKQLLVCEYASNKNNVSELLHSDKCSTFMFNWKRRAAVCIGVARGLSYLHEEIVPRAIHCDIKPSNILLDIASFVPKITDFDLIDFVDGRPTSSAGLRGSTKGRNIRVESTSTYKKDSVTHATVKGTLGYLDPEYYFKGRLTEKVDVYSFGLVVLELIAGRRVVDLEVKEVRDQWILSWVKRKKKDRTVLEIVDPKLTDFPPEDVERFINVALLCTQANSKQRPSMFRVVHMLCGGHKSDEQISEMATAVVDAPPVQWLSDNSTVTSESMCSILTASTSGKADITEGSTSRGRKEDASQSRGGKGSSNGACLGVNSSTSVEEEEEEQSCDQGDLVREYFERSMEKIMRFQAATKAAQSMVIGRKSSQRVCLEAVYPPFLSGEYARRPFQF